MYYLLSSGFLNKTKNAKRVLIISLISRRCHRPAYIAPRAECDWAKVESAHQSMSCATHFDAPNGERCGASAVSTN